MTIVWIDILSVEVRMRGIYLLAVKYIGTNAVGICTNTMYQ